MTTMTIHAEDVFAVALRDYARNLGKSVNQTVKDVFAPLLGLGVAAEKKESPLLRFYGAAGESIDEKGWDVDISTMRVVDAEMWK